MTIWRKWLGRSGPSMEMPPPNIGEGVRAYAIGDIHGRADLLDELLTLIARDDSLRPPTHRRLVLLGDLVDRGPASRQVVERVMALVGSYGDICCLKGNHEEVFAMAAQGNARAVPLFRRIGGIQTLASYGLDEMIGDMMRDDDIADWMLNHVPRDHVDFVDALPDSIEIGDYLFVHAGIRPRVPIAEQQAQDMRWIRHEFLDHAAPHPRMIVHGHSITEDVDERDNRIGIDTGAFFSGRLTAIGLEGAERWFLQTGE